MRTFTQLTGIVIAFTGEDAKNKQIIATSDQVSEFVLEFNGKWVKFEVLHYLSAQALTAQELF